MREADASCDARVVPPAVPSNASRDATDGEDRDRCDGIRISDRQWRADAVGPTAVGVVVRLVLLLRTAVLLGSATTRGRQVGACKKRPQRDPQASGAQARSGCPILFCHGRDSGLNCRERPCLLASWPVHIAETPSVQGGVSATRSATRGGFGNESRGLGNDRGVSVLGLKGPFRTARTRTSAASGAEVQDRRGDSRGSRLCPWQAHRRLGGQARSCRPGQSP